MKTQVFKPTNESDWKAKHSYRHFSNVLEQMFFRW
jgi:hypothetical protein